MLICLSGAFVFYRTNIYFNIFLNFWGGEKLQIVYNFAVVSLIP